MHKVSVCSLWLQSVCGLYRRCPLAVPMLVYGQGAARLCISLCLRAFGMARAHRIYAVVARPSDGEIEEHEAVDHGQLTLIQYGQEGLRCVDHEVSDRHLAGEEKGHWPCAQADQDQGAAHQLQ